MRNFLILIIFFVITGCGKNIVEKTDEAIDVALTHLSQKQCDKALNVLLDIGNQTENAVYLQVLASAYACKSGFNEIRFISNDLTSIDAESPQTIVKSLATLTLSPETSADSDAYTSIRNGINVLLHSTPGSPGQNSRKIKFGPRKAGDIGVQALILSLVNLGKFLRYYGNTDSSGNKGANPGNNCFLKYTDPRAQLLISGGVTGACLSNVDGHPDIDLTTDAGKRRMCEGIMLLTNSLDILNNIDLSSSSNLSILEEVSVQVNSFKTAAISAGLETIVSMTSQKTCEAYAAVPSQLLDLEYFYALVFEEGLL